MTKRTDPKPPEHRAKISEALKAYHRERGHLQKYQKSGPDHTNWKGGKQSKFYQVPAYEAYPPWCNRCGSTKRLLVHHRDRDPTNHLVTNLEILCHACHMKEHHGLRVVWTCLRCGVSRELVPSEARVRRYCSHRCRNLARYGK